MDGLESLTSAVVLFTFMMVICVKHNFCILDMVSVNVPGGGGQSGKGGNPAECSEPSNEERNKEKRDSRVGKKYSKNSLAEQ